MSDFDGDGLTFWHVVLAVITAIAIILIMTSLAGFLMESPEVPNVPTTKTRIDCVVFAHLLEKGISDTGCRAVYVWEVDDREWELVQFIGECDTLADVGHVTMPPAPPSGTCGNQHPYE